MISAGNGRFRPFDAKKPPPAPRHNPRRAREAQRGYEDAALLAESLLYVKRLGRSFMRTSETRKLKPA
jgi:hypothetical protein